MDKWEPLIEGCKRNDRVSQEVLYKRLYPALFTLCKKFYADEHEAQTALNSGMLKVYKNIHQYEAEKGSFFNWVYSIVRNTAITLLKQRKQNLFVGLEENHIDLMDSELLDSNDWDELFLRLGKLPEVTRVVCSLFYLEEYSIKEIVEKLEMKEGTVKWHLNQSRVRLRQLFSKDKPNQHGR